MTDTQPDAPGAPGSVVPARKRSPRGTGRARLVGAAAGLFVERGVGGTSLQAIADRLGVTKAAVYHQFATKDEIVLAVAEQIIVRLGAIADSAEAAARAEEAVRVTIDGLADLVVSERGLASIFQTDPAMAQILDTHETYRTQIARIDAILLGPAPTVQRRIAFAFAGGGVMSLGGARGLDDVPDDVLRPAIASAMSRALAVDGSFSALQGSGLLKDSAP
jgi:AcrR family transcriptional regulator